MLTFIFQETAISFNFKHLIPKFISSLTHMRPESNQDLKSLGLRTMLSQKSFDAKLFMSHSNCFPWHQIQTLFCLLAIFNWSSRVFGSPSFNLPKEHTEICAAPSSSYLQPTTALVKAPSTVLFPHQRLLSRHTGENHRSLYLPATCFFLYCVNL